MVEIKEISEFSLIRHLTKNLKTPGSDSVLVGIGDDAAVFRLGEGKIFCLLVTC